MNDPACGQTRALRSAAIAAALLLGAALTHAQSPRLSNISTRGPVGTGTDVMIAGLVVGPGDPDTVLIRAVGPSLSQFGATGLLQAPVLTVFDASGSVILSNQGWGSGNATAALMSEAGAFPLLAGSTDSALVATLAAGTYTAEVSGAGGTTGLALLEVYELGATAGTARLANLSTRGEVGTSGNIMIPGITIGAGSGERTLLIRAAGPALTQFGVTGTLADPAMSVVGAAGNVIASNDNWGTPDGGGSGAAALAAAFGQAGAFSFAAGSLDAALIVSVPPGSYTVLVSGNSASTGVALVEVYDITGTIQSGPDVVTIAATQPDADTSGSNPGAFTVTRTGDTSSPLTVDYVVGGSAVNGLDYRGLAGTVTLPAYASSAVVAVTPIPSLSEAPTSSVVLTLAAGASYSVGGAASATVNIQFTAPTLYVAQIRPTPGAAGSAGSGVATILVSSDGTLASVGVSFSNLSSGEVIAQVAIGGDTNNGTNLIDLPQGQVSGYQWVPAGAGAYTAAQVLAALASGNVYVEIDSAAYPGGELGGQFVAGAGSQAFTPPSPPPSIDLTSVPPADAPRFLAQATFGPTAADIASLQAQGYAGWIASQMALPETSHRSATDADAAAYPPTGQFAVVQNDRQAAWWLISITAPDQLRQRVAFALSEIFVTSDVASQLANQPDGLATYYDMLAKDAFGNFRQLLQDVTLSPAMGNYLNMLRNAKANAAKGTSADENYAREVQQLFTIGLDELQPDGTLMLDSTGLPIPTYGQDEIVQTANVFTGWGYSSTASSPSFYGAAADFDDPMMPYPAYHDETQKTVINGTVIPASQAGTADLQMELDALFNHPNTGPFICQQLIQRLVTSNPSPGYVYRVAQVFANDGTGTRGNLAAVVKAILLDYEARSPATAAGVGYGKLKEPLLRMTGLYRAFAGAAADGRYAVFNAQVPLDQAALRSPTVFNFFDPGYAQQGALASAGLLAPEFQITDASTAISVPNDLYSAIYTPASPPATTIVLNLAALTANASDPAAMAATLSQLLCGGAMSASTQQQIVAALGALPKGTSPSASAQMALYLAATSPDAAIQR
jgi:uncharacterized protein (DUF1800 family)